MRLGRGHTGLDVVGRERDDNSWHEDPDIVVQNEDAVHDHDEGVESRVRAERVDAT